MAWALRQHRRDRYDDGGVSGGTLERPALWRMLADIERGRIDVIVCYKIDRLSRALMDFAKLVEVFDANSVTFVSVTQSFNTTTSMGRLTLNILLSFAQFERELIGERIRDKVAASRARGIWMGGCVPLGYDARVLGAGHDGGRGPACAGAAGPAVGGALPRRAGADHPPPGGPGIPSILWEQSWEQKKYRPETRRIG